MSVIGSFKLINSSTKRKPTKCASKLMLLPFETDDEWRTVYKHILEMWADATFTGKIPSPPMHTFKNHPVLLAANTMRLPICAQTGYKFSVLVVSAGNDSHIIFDYRGPAVSDDNAYTSDGVPLDVYWNKDKTAALALCSECDTKELCVHYAEVRHYRAGSMVSTEVYNRVCPAVFGVLQRKHKFDVPATDRKLCLFYNHFYDPDFDESDSDSEW